MEAVTFFAAFYGGVACGMAAIIIRVIFITQDKE